MSLLKYIIEEKPRKKRIKKYVIRSFILDKEISDNLKQIAAYYNVPQSEIVRELLKSFISQHKEILKETTYVLK